MKVLFPACAMKEAANRGGLYSFNRERAQRPKPAD